MCVYLPLGAQCFLLPSGILPDGRAAPEFDAHTDVGQRQDGQRDKVVHQHQHYVVAGIGKYIDMS